jgi:gliding motility-associated-like protein
LTLAINALGQAPVANFSANPTGGCSPLIVNFQDLSTGNPVSWNWDFGNGNTSVLQNPSATYFIPGTYTVSLTVTNASGTNTLTRTQYLTVHDIPTVSFSADNQTGCFPLRVQFTDLSTAGAGNTNTTWQWDFGNGVLSSLQNPVAVYTTAGSFTVTLKVTNDKGCVKTISRPNFVIVTPGVTAGFTQTLPSVCQAPATINFTNTSTGPPALTWLWDFGDGNTSAVQDPVHTYNTAGSYTVTLIATSSAGCQDTFRTAVPIIVGGITTNFTGPASVCLNSIASFTNTATPSPVNSSWTFGDGGTSTDINPTHIYAAPGTYTVTLYNSYGNCTDSATQTVVVNPLPVANFTAPTTIKCQPDFPVSFQDQSTGAVSWQWDFGDGNTSTLQNPSHTYTSYGSFPVTLIVTNAFGCTDTIVQPAFVRISRPVISIPGLPARGCIPFTFNFSPTITSLDAITSWQWTFGDGGSSTAANPTYTYNAQGTYTVKLIITTSTGCTDSIVIPGAVRVGSKPVADFSGAPSPVCAFQDVLFNDLSVPADEWLWQFGDGTTSTSQNPSHSFSATGLFTVTLIASNNGCSDTIVKPNYIDVLPPIAQFDFTADCSNRLRFTFTDQSTGAISWSWDFGDGTTSVLQNPVHVFPALGVYTVTLVVTNGNCTHSVVQTIQVIDQVPDFSVSPNPICRGEQMVFTPLNIDYSRTGRIEWDFGNGVVATVGGGPFSYLYPATGTYTIKLRITDVNGCIDSVVKVNYVRVNGPRAIFGAVNPGGCRGNVTTFNDLSTTDGINALTSWTWDFGDGHVQSFSAPPFQHAYDTIGTFSVKLIVRDAAGCLDSTVMSNIINTTDPIPDFVSADTLTCPGAVVSFTNLSTANQFTSNWDFGDGGTSTITSPTHSYTATGFYTIKLAITDVYGCRDSLTRNNYIHVALPDAAFTVNDSIGSCLPLEVQFTNTSAFYNSSFWEFGDGGTSSITNPAHYYSLPGNFIAKLVVTNPGGCKDSTIMNIVVNDTSGARLDYTPVSGCNPLSIALNVLTSAVIESYYWDFGDGNTLITTTPAITHNYTTFGNFIPKVILLDPAGCLIPLTGYDTLRIIGSNPDFSASPGIVCDSGYVSFSDSTTTSDRVISYSWDFGDGGSSTDQNPTHYYTTPGVFNVTLTVQTESGCQNSITIPAAVRIALRPLIGIVGDTEICVNESILHSGIFLRPDTSVVNWQWSFPNGNSSTLQNPPQQTYTSAGNFVVTAISTNSLGCRDTTTQNILVHPLPTATMPAQMVVQSGFPVQIPVTYSTGVNSWAWTPPAGLSCTTCDAPLAGPKFNTNYRVRFSDENGCVNTDTIQVIVFCKDNNLFMPNTFSPNGDGSNDVFYPRGKGLYSIRLLRVFNRWGEVVFEKRDFPVNNAAWGWDGTFKGKKQPDVYVFQVEMFCDNGDLLRFEGNVALIL